MAIARCDKCGPPVGLKSSYGHPHEAKVGRRLTCGATDCAQPVSYVWLSDAEEAEYVNGERFFVAGSKNRTVELR
jgi:hypothetical protein